MGRNLLEAKNLSVGYGRHAVLHGVNFSIEEGDFLGVMGPNGAGKTTLLKTFLGLLKPLAGSIEMRRSAGGGISRFYKVLGPLAGGVERRGGGHPLFGYVPQRESLDLHFPLTSLEVAAMGRYGRLGPFRRLSSEDMRVARACLRQTRMEAYAEKPYRKLSGGQKQRVLIARALASEPEILLLDEPTNGMDVNSERAIMELLTELQKDKRTTVVFVTHLLSTIEKYARRVALITFNGKLLVGEKSKMLDPEVLAGAYKAK